MCVERKCHVEISCMCECRVEAVCVNAALKLYVLMSRAEAVRAEVAQVSCACG